VPLALALALALALTATACQCRKEPPAPERREVGLAIPAPPIRVLHEEVLHRGESPDSLRYRAAAGAVHEHRRRVATTLEELTDATRKPPRRLPAVTTRFTLRRAPDGGLAVEVHEPAIDAGADAAAIESTELQLARFRTLLAGKKSVIALDDRGHIGRVGALTPAGGGALARRDLAAALLDAVVVLPEGPIGVGGRWRVTRAVPRGASAVKQIATYELRERRGPTLTVDVELLTVGERQPISLPDLPPGARAEMLALRVHVSGTLTVDLAAPLAVGGELRRTDKIHVRTELAGRRLHDYYSQSESTLELETR
jgi:hypothetical protein